MPAKDHKLLAWSPERADALAAWLKRGRELGVSFAAPNGQHSDAAAVGEALKRAAACRCGVGPCDGLDRMGGRARAKLERARAGLRTK